MAKKAKKTVKKSGPKPKISDMTMLAAHAGVPWEQAAISVKGQQLDASSPDWETAVAQEHARMCHLWADCMVRAGK
jgi:hypothetical protein